MILRNSAGLAGIRVVTKLATTALLILVARILGDADFGVLSSILAVSVTFGVIQEAGLTVPMIRRIAESRSQHGLIVGEVVTMKLMLAVPALIGFGIMSVGLDASGVALALFAVSMVLEVINVSLVRSFEGVESVRDIGKILVAERGVLVVAGWCAVALGGGLTGLGAAYVAANTTSLLTAVHLWRRQGLPVLLGLDMPGRRAHPRGGTIPSRRGAGAGVQPDRRPSPDGVGTTCFRRMVHRRHAHHRSGVLPPGGAYGHDLPGAVADGCLGPGRVPLPEPPGRSRGLCRRPHRRCGDLGVRGVDHQRTLRRRLRPAAGLLRVLSWMVPLYFLNLFMGTALIAMRREGYSTLTLAAGAVTGTVLNVLLIPSWGVEGAAYARVWTEVVCAGVQVTFFWVALRPDRPAETKV